MAETPVLEVRNLRKRYRKGGSLLHPEYLQAVDGVSFSVARGEAFGIVGESGCGKSTLAKLIMGLEVPDSGAVLLNGTRIDGLPEGELRPLRPRFQMVFQDSGSSLNPRQPVSAILGDPIRAHRIRPAEAVPDRVLELLRMVGLPADAAGRYPHEFSGGQRQRICIARALALEPELLVLDEPVSALDVSVQAQILNLIRDLQEELRLTCIFIGHGLSAVHYISDHIAVMYLGRVVERGPSDEVFVRPVHPYTAALLDASPIVNYELRDRPRIALRGDLSSEAGDPGHVLCPFRDRCPCAVDECGKIAPEWAELPGSAGHGAVCFRGEGLLRR